jgi:fatty-acyl-CoA synthase
MAGAPCPIEVMRRVNESMNMREVTIASGMTETSPVSFQSATDDPLERRVSTVGRIHPHVEVKVVDLDGRVVPRGEQGELCTRGYSVVLGYWDKKEKPPTCSMPTAGCNTGDIAVIDVEGYCNIVGRIKDMVIRGGENSTRARSRNFSIAIQKSRTCRFSASPTPAMARSFAPGSGHERARR